MQFPRESASDRRSDCAGEPTYSVRGASCATAFRIDFQGILFRALSLGATIRGMYDMAGQLSVLTRDALVQAQLPPSLRSITQAGAMKHMVGMAGAPVIVGDSPKTPQERAAAFHGVPLSTPRGYVAPTIVGHGGHGGHGHGGRGGRFFGGWGGWGNWPNTPNVYVFPQAGPDCSALAAQAQAQWAKFGVTQVYCGTDPTGRPSLVAVSSTPTKARASIPPTFGNMPTSVQ